MLFSWRYMVAQILVVIRSFKLRTLVIFAGVLGILLMGAGPAFAQPASKQEAMRQRAQRNIAIAEEQYQRGLYKETEQTLLKTQSQHDAYMNSQDRRKVDELLAQVRLALTEREKIAAYLQASDELGANRQYLEAKSRLEVIKDNHFLTAGERKQVAAAIKKLETASASHTKQVQNLFDESIKLYRAGQIEAARAGFAEVAISNTEIASKARAAVEMIKNSEPLTAAERNQIAASIRDLSKSSTSHEGRIHGLFNKSVRLYQAGQFEQARAGFVEVILSGVKVTADRTPQDYVRLIDEALIQRQQIPGFESAAATEDKTDMGVEDELLGIEPAEMPAEPSAEPEQIKAEPAPEAKAQVPPEPQALPEAVTRPKPQQPAPAATPPEAEPTEPGYIGIIEQKRRRQISYTQAVVIDAEAKAQQYLLANEFGRAKQALAAAMSVVNKNKLLLGNDLYKQYSERLSGLDEQITSHQNDYITQQQVLEQAQTQQLRRQMRETMEAQRSQAVKDYMDRAYTFSKEQRYEEALGQLEQLLAVDPLNNRALIYKTTLEDTVRWRTQLEIQKESEKEELELLIESGREGIPFASKYRLPRDWKELTAGREEDVMAGLSPIDAAVYAQLDQIVDISSLTESTSFSDAVDIVRTSVEPYLTIVVMWGDLSENAFVEQTTPINMSGEGLTSVRLRTGLLRLLQAVGGTTIEGLPLLGFSIEDGIITIATTDSLPANFVQEVYDVGEVVSAPAMFMGGGGMGGGMGGMGGGMGGMSGGMGGMSGGMGGMSGGMGGMSGGMGGMSGGMGGMSGGMGGMSGGMGGMGGGMGGMGGGIGIAGATSRAYQLRYIIQETIEPESWYVYGGQGVIYPFGGTKLIVWQKPSVHKKIRDLMDKLRKLVGDQVAIEARFLLVDENFLEDIGIDTNITLKLGRRWSGTGGVPEEGTFGIGQNSSTAVIPGATKIASSLAEAGASNPAFSTNITYDGGALFDDLTVNFIIRATQMHANSRVLTAPKATVLNGESASLSIQQQQNYVSNKNWNSETVTVGTERTETVVWSDPELSSYSTGVTLSITPTITADKKYVILMVMTYLNDLLSPGTGEGSVKIVDPGTGDILTDTFDLPELQNTNLMTRVTIPDQGTVLLGGLTLSAEREIQSGVPVLSKIPVLGRLFSNRSEVKDKQILLILVKPTIILKEEEEAKAIAAMEEER